MIEVTLTQLNGYAMVAFLVHWMALWLGMYLASRRSLSRAAVLTGLAFVCGAVYLLKAAYFFIPTTVEGVVEREKWLGGWVAFTPVLLAHAFMLLTGVCARWCKWLLAFLYSLAALVFAAGFFDGVFSEYRSVTLDADGYVVNLPPGRFYWVVVAQMVLTLLVALVVLTRARFAHSVRRGVARRQLDVLLVGTVLLTVGIAQILIHGAVEAPIPHAVLFPFVIAGTAMMAFPLLRYSGRLGGQVLRSDARSSATAAAVMVGAYLGVAAAVDARVSSVAATGWLMIFPVALGSELFSLTDRVAYGSSARARRAGLRTAEAYVGAANKIDLDAINAGQSGDVVGFLSQLDRAGLGQGSLASSEQGWLRLLSRDEFSPVRQALGVSEEWKPGVPLSHADIRRRMKAKLIPRERQALGLWYLGHSDKEMARLMGVKPNVPRSYLNEGKKKLGLPSGPPLALLVHFSGFVMSDALPLLESRVPGDGDHRSD